MYTRFAKAGENLFDVAQEQPVRPYDDDTLAFKRKMMGVEEVGGAVERDLGPALHLHDVPHRAGHGSVCAVPHDREPGWADG